MHDELNVLIGGEAGQGLVTVGQILARSLVRSGFLVVVTQSYHSRIRGGHNTFAIRAGTKNLRAPRESVDVLVALNDETVALHRGELVLEGIVIADELIATPPFLSSQHTDSVDTLARNSKANTLSGPHCSQTLRARDAERARPEGLLESRPPTVRLDAHSHAAAPLTSASLECAVLTRHRGHKHRASLPAGVAARARAVPASRGGGARRGVRLRAMLARRGGRAYVTTGDGESCSGCVRTSIEKM